MISRRNIPWAALVAAFALFFAQILLASHESEHLGHGDEESCAVCLAATPIGSPLNSAPSTPTFASGLPLFEWLSAYAAVTETFRSAHHARAPPTPVRL
jgi:hypothetical protein